MGTGYGPGRRVNTGGRLPDGRFLERRELDAEQVVAKSGPLGLNSSHDLSDLSGLVAPAERADGFGRDPGFGIQFPAPEIVGQRPALQHRPPGYVGPTLKRFGRAFHGKLEASPGIASTDHLGDSHSGLSG